MKRTLIWSVSLILVGVSLAIMVAGNLNPSVRAPLTLAYFLVGPGMAFVLWLRIGDWIIELILAVALSIALATLTSEAMLFAGTWSSTGAALGLITWTVASTMVLLARTLMARSSAQPQPGAHNVRPTRHSAQVSTVPNDGRRGRK